MYLPFTCCARCLDTCVFYFADNFPEVYQCQFKLACYFQNTGDKWLADHFFTTCLATSAGVKGDGGKMAAEGHCNVGLALEESGLFIVNIYPVFYKL